MVQKAVWNIVLQNLLSISAYFWPLRSIIFWEIFPIEHFNIQIMSLFFRVSFILKTPKGTIIVFNTNIKDSYVDGTQALPYCQSVILPVRLFSLAVSSVRQPATYSWRTLQSVS